MIERSEQVNDGTLYRKIAEVVAEVGGVEKDGTNTFHKYNYTSAEAMLRALRGPLASRHVALMPSVTEIAEREITTANGKTSTITTVRVSFTFADGETGAMHRCDWAGQGDDPADKGLGKAYTNAVKTFLREVFLIPQGDDPEADARTDERAAQRVAAEPAGNGSGRPLSAENRVKVIDAIAEAGERLDLVLASVGLESVEEMTATHAHQIKTLLDGVKA